MARYEYRPLQAGSEGTEEIRLIRLLPGRASADIEVEVFHEFLSSKPTYEALSYAWGSLDLTDVIFVSKQEAKRRRPSSSRVSSLVRYLRGGQKSMTTLRITRNLEIALRHLRYSDEPRVMWIDAVCINQLDKDERGSQVKRMDTIFGNARLVTVWLGPGSENSDLAIESLHKVGREINYIPGKQRLHYMPGGWVEYMMRDPNALRSHMKGWRAIGDLLRRRWFSRLWVFQEIGLAKDAVVIVGKSSLNWEVFKAGTFWCVSSAKQSEMFGLDDTQATQVRGFLNVTGHRDVQFRSLAMLLWVTKERQCYDARDRLYAIRSLCGPIERRVIRPDYSKDVDEVYRTTTIRYINYTGVLNILDLCGFKKPPSDTEPPSWVPVTLHPAGGLSMASYFLAAGRSKIAVPYEESEYRLGVHGIKVATIAHLAPSIPEASTDLEVLRICRTWEPLDFSSASYIGGGSKGDAFLEAIIWGRMKEHMPLGLANYMTLSECRDVFSLLDDDGKVSADSMARCAEDLRKALLGRRYFKSEEGYVGLCPESAEIGDRIFVLLGYHSPLALRQAAEGQNDYHVVGECYVPGMMDSEALTGPLPPGWSRRCIANRLGSFSEYLHSDTRTQQDPRLGPLPSGWRMMYGTYARPQEVEAERDEHRTLHWFENTETGENSRFDPRLTPQALRARGVDIQEFNMI